MKAYLLCIVLYVIILTFMCVTIYNLSEYFKLIEDKNVKNSVSSIAALVWLYLLGLRIPNIYDALKG